MLYSILIGAISGFLAHKVMKSSSHGLLINTILGIIGGLLASWLFGVLEVSFIEGWIGDLIKGVIGAAALIFAGRFFKKK